MEPVVPQSTDEINLLDSDLQNCPYHAYKLLRDEAPVWQDPLTGFYVVTQFGDLRQLLLDTENFSNGSNSNARSQVDTERARRMRELYEAKGWVPAPTLAGRDDPNHKQMRAMFDEAFRPRRIKSMEPLVEGTARKLIDAFIDDGSCDWVQQFSVPMPLIIIGQQMQHLRLGPGSGLLRSHLALRTERTQLRPLPQQGRTDLSRRDGCAVTERVDGSLRYDEPAGWTGNPGRVP